ncbi:hypothetical protein MUK42_22806 [Musa troglodytarum]|uniref:Uncharacterized protein n=1 Tax=Musa troglodytarum TaxID=320322 RepID=A0A9E7HTR9_9LILI|nr:hypothetical protein MUK42_22806 [Musa troglodytarum]
MYLKQQQRERRDRTAAARKGRVALRCPQRARARRSASPPRTYDDPKLGGVGDRGTPNERPRLHNEEHMGAVCPHRVHRSVIHTTYACGRDAHPSNPLVHRSERCRR